MSQHAAERWQTAGHGRAHCFDTGPLCKGPDGFEGEIFARVEVLQGDTEAHERCDDREEADDRHNENGDGFAGDFETVR